MMATISSDIYILTARELDERERKAYQRGVERGRFEERMDNGTAPVAYNCKNWTGKHGTVGYCEVCGAQTQGMEVGSDYKCPRFERRS